MNARRQYFRVPSRLEARLILRGESPVDANISDVSSNGLSMVVKSDTLDASLAIRRWLDVGAFAHVEVSLNGTQVILPGRITWTRPVDGTRELMAGLCFEQLDGPAERVLRGWLVKGLAAIQGAARHVLLERWEDAAECLLAVGIDDAQPPMVSAVLKYAAGEYGNHTPPPHDM